MSEALIKTGNLDEIMKTLEDGIMQFMESDSYKNYLRAVSKFHTYSSNNVTLIAMQRPDATLVAGFNTWKNQFNRHVMKGEKGIKIIAPMPVTVEKEQDRVDQYGNTYRETVSVVVPRFKAVNVFDVSQTEGDPLPNIDPAELKAEINDYDRFLKALEKTAGVPISYIDIDTSAKGFYQSEKNEIYIKRDMGETQTVKTLIHEIAHSVLHNRDTGGVLLPSKTKEVQAESVAFAVCSHFGIDTSEYTFPYISAWSGEQDLATLKDSIETIRDTSSLLIRSIEDNYIGKENERLPADKEKKGAER